MTELRLPERGALVRMSAARQRHFCLLAARAESRELRERLEALEAAIAEHRTDVQRGKGTPRVADRRLWGLLDAENAGAA